MAWYRAGTVAVTNGSGTITGTGTAFVDNALIGHGIALPDGRVYEIAAIASATSLTIAPTYLGSTASAQGYAIVPTQGFAQTAAVLIAQLITDYQAVTTGAGAGKFADGNVSAPGITFTADQDSGLYRSGTNTIGVACGGTSVANFGSTVSTLNGNLAYSGILELGNGGSGNRPSYVNFRADDTYAAGLSIYRDQIGPNSMSQLTHRGTNQFALIGVEASAITLWTNSVTRLVVQADGHTRPGTDNAYSLGVSGTRWTQLHAATSTIATSDERDKQWRGELDADELAAAREIAQSIGVYQFHDAIGAKGADGARLHIGVKAQEVMTIMTAHGLEPMRYAFLCYDSWEAVAAELPRAAVEPTPAGTNLEGYIIAPPDPGSPAFPGTPGREAGDRYGLRYEELAMFLAAAQEQRLSALEAA